MYLKKMLPVLISYFSIFQVIIHQPKEACEYLMSTEHTKMRFTCDHLI